MSRNATAAWFDRLTMSAHPELVEGRGPGALCVLRVHEYNHGRETIAVTAHGGDRRVSRWQGGARRAGELRVVQRRRVDAYSGEDPRAPRRPVRLGADAGQGRRSLE